MGSEGSDHTDALHHGPIWNLFDVVMVQKRFWAPSGETLLAVLSLDVACCCDYSSLSPS